MLALISKWRISKHNPDLRGFSLIEVSIVLFIILLMTSATVPWMKNFSENTRLKSAARGIRDLLEFARASAINERTEYAVVFDLENAQYLLTSKEALDTETDGTMLNSSLSEISQNITDLQDEEAENQTQTETESYVSRTAGVAGVPNQVPESIQMIELRSMRSTGSGLSIDYVVFYPDSTAEDFEIYLQSASGKVFVVSVTESTGRAGVRKMTDVEIEQMGLIEGQRQ